MLSQTVEYALRAMVHVAAHDGEASLNSESIAQRTQVPKGYLSKILRDLVVANLIRSQRGPNGGFTLARPAANISMLDVINAVDPIAHLTQCPLGNPAHLALCPLHRRLEDAVSQIELQFRQTSLAEVLSAGSTNGQGCRALQGRAAPQSPGEYVGE